jgi:hypothetical protein
MVLGYDYSNQKWWWWRKNAPHQPAVLTATAECWSNTDGIAQCGMSRATPEATGCRHWATTCSVSPQWPPGQQANKYQSTNTPKKQAVLMAMAMRRYITARIAQWRRSRASLEATGRCHWASIMSNNINRTWVRHFFQCFHRQNRRKRSRVDAKTPIFNRGMTHQTKEKGSTKVTIKFIWGGIPERMTYARVVIVLCLYLLEQCLNPVLRTSTKTHNCVTLHKFLIHLGMHHTRKILRSSRSSFPTHPTSACLFTPVGTMRNTSRT